MRKFATEGTKISTSASITNMIVSSRSLADKPRPRRSAVAASGERIALTRSHSLADRERASSIISRGTRTSLLAKSRQPANHFTHQWFGGRGGIIAEGCALVYLRQRRIGRNPLRHSPDIKPLRHRERPNLDELAC